MMALRLHKILQLTELPFYKMHWDIALWTEKDNQKELRL